MTSHSGPLTLLEGEVTADDVEVAARIAARYGQGRDAGSVEFDAVVDGLSRVVAVQPRAPENVMPEWVL